MIIDWWMAIYHRIVQIMDENNYQSCTLVGPGRRWKRMAYHLCEHKQIIKVIDRDPYLYDFYGMFKFIDGDVIFDEIPLEGDVVISCHAEKHYPITSQNQIVILDTQPNKPIEGREIEGFMTSNCTTEEHFNNIVERYEFGGYEYMIENEKGCDNYVLLHIQN